MALHKINQVELSYMDTWFSNIIDSVNFNLDRIESEVPNLESVLTTLDSAPIKYLKDSLDELVDNINKGFSEIEMRLKALQERSK